MKQEREFLARKLLDLEPASASLLQPAEIRPYKKRKNSSSDTISDINKPLKKKEKVQQTVIKKQITPNQLLPKVPVVIDGINVLCFGRIILDRPAFYNDVCIYPAAYKISRLFMNKMFVCHIKINETGAAIAPVFEISLASDPQNFTFTGDSTDEVHSDLLQTFNNNVGMMIDGDAFFGLKNKRIRDFINLLPNAKAKKLIKIKQEIKQEKCLNFFDENARNYI